MTQRSFDKNELISIFKHLENRHLIVCKYVCKRWYELLKENKRLTWKDFNQSETKELTQFLYTLVVMDEIEKKVFRRNLFIQSLTVQNTNNLLFQSSIQKNKRLEPAILLEYFGPSYGQCYDFQWMKKTLLHNIIEEDILCFLDVVEHYKPKPNWFIILHEEFDLSKKCYEYLLQILHRSYPAGLAYFQNIVLAHNVFESKNKKLKIKI